jgi:hypothetical protein
LSREGQVAAVHRQEADLAALASPSVLSAGAGPRLAVAAALIALLWLAVWWALAA